jgi:hypothetical protein
VGTGDWLEHTAHPAWLPPDAVAQLATGVKPLVLKGRDQHEVGQVIVLPVAVPVVDMEALGEGAMGALPDNDVGHPGAAPDIDPVIATGGRVPGAAGMVALA